MAKEFFSYDPMYGITTSTEFDESTNKMTVYSEQDVQALVDRNAELRNTGATNKGIKENWWFVAAVPMTVLIELQRQGLNYNDPNDQDRIAQVLQRDYPYLTTTSKQW